MHYLCWITTAGPVPTSYRHTARLLYMFGNGEDIPILFIHLILHFAKGRSISIILGFHLTSCGSAPVPAALSQRPYIMIISATVYVLLNVRFPSASQTTYADSVIAR